MADIKLHELIDGYENSGGENFVGQRFFRREITGAATISARRKKRSKIRRALNSLLELITYANIKTYGFLFLTFGLLTIIFYFAKDFLIGYNIPVTNDISLVAGIIAAILSIPMMILDGPICQVLQEYLITDIIFFDFLCIKRLPPDKEYAPNAVSAVLLGVLLGVIGLFVPTITVVAIVFFCVYAYLSMESPEFSLFSTIIILPYLSVDQPEGYGILVTLVIITAISFVRKLVYGKRVLNIEQYDILIGLMLVAVLISGFVNSGIASTEWSIKYISLSLVYILAGNIITNRRLADCAVQAIIFSAVIPALTSLVTLFRDVFTSGSLEGIYYNGISSVYSTREVAAAHFAVSVAMAVAMSIQTKGNIRAGYIAIGAFIFLGLLLTFEPFAYIAVVLGIAAYLAIRRGGAYVLLLLPIALVPYAIVSVIPEGILDTVLGPATDGLMPDNITNLWGAVLKIFGDSPIIGIGIGSEAFGEKISQLGFNVTNSHNIFLEIATEAGIIALVAFIFIIWVRVRHRVNYHKYLIKSDVNVISSSASCAVFVLITIGATVYIWQDMSLYYIFWCVFGIGSATLRVAKQESDDRELYSRMMVNFHESANNEFSSVDVPVKKKK